MAKLIDAIRHGDIEALKLCIAADIELNQPIVEFPQQTPIALALEYFLRAVNENNPLVKNFISIIELLVQSGAKTNCLLEGKNTLLHKIVTSYQRSYGKAFNIVDSLLTNAETIEKETARKSKQQQKKTWLIQVAKSLLKAGLSFDQENADNEMPFTLALKNQFEEMVLLFLDEGADIYYRDAQQNTLLHYAARKELPQLFDRVITVLDLHAQNATGLTALDYIHDPKIILILLQKGAIARQKDLIDFFILAEQQENQPLIEYLFKNGLAQYQRSQGGTALFFTKSFDHFCQLIECGADIHAVWRQPQTTHKKQGQGNDNDSQSVEHKVTLFEHLVWRIREPVIFKKIQWLIQKGFKSIPYETLYHQLISIYAFSHEKNEWQQVFEYWLKQGAHLNGQDEAGDTPMHIAARQGALHIMSYLLENHAKIDCLNKEGERPLDVFNRVLLETSSSDNRSIAYKILQLFLANYPNDQIPKNYLTIVRFIISMGDLLSLKQFYAQLKQSNCFLVPALLWQYTIDTRQLEVVKWLSAENFPVDDKLIKEKYTPLQYAVLNSNMAIVESLFNQQPESHGENRKVSLWYFWLESLSNFEVGIPAEEAMQEKIKLFHWLIEKKFSIESLDASGKNILELLLEKLLNFPNEVIPFIDAIIAHCPLLLTNKLRHDLLLNLLQLQAFTVIGHFIAQDYVDVNQPLSLQTDET